MQRSTWPRLLTTTVIVALAALLSVRWRGGAEGVDPADRAPAGEASGEARVEDARLFGRAGPPDPSPRPEESGPAASPGAPAPPRSTSTPGALVLVSAVTDRDTYELGEPVRIRRVFENPTDGEIRVSGADWRSRVHGEVGLTCPRGSRLYEPATQDLPDVVVEPHGRVANEVAVEIHASGTWTIEIPPEYQARSGRRPRFDLTVTVIDRGDPRHLAAKAERLARLIEREGPDCPTCWSEAQKDLESIGPPVVPHLRRWVREAASPYLRAVAAKILGIFVHRGEPGREDLLAGTTDVDPGVRKICVDALGGGADDATLDVLLPRLQDSDPWVRIEAVDAVARADDPRVVPALVARLEDGDGYVRQWAAVRLAEKGNAAGIGVLMAALETDPAGDAYSVVAALEKLTGVSFGNASMPYLLSDFEQIDEAVRQNEALAKRWLAWWEDEGKTRYGR